MSQAQICATPSIEPCLLFSCQFVCSSPCSHFLPQPQPKSILILHCAITPLAPTRRWRRQQVTPTPHTSRTISSRSNSPSQCGLESGQITYLQPVLRHAPQASGVWAWKGCRSWHSQHRYSSLTAGQVMPGGLVTHLCLRNAVSLPFCFSSAVQRYVVTFGELMVKCTFSPVV